MGSVAMARRAGNQPATAATNAVISSYRQGGQLELMITSWVRQNGGMRLVPTMPEFMIATLRLGDDITDELIAASRVVRPLWNEAFAEHRDFIPHIKELVRSGKHCVHHPLVQSFMTAWALNIRWGNCDSGCWDAIGVNVPRVHLESLAKLGGVEGFEIMLGDRAAHCCASLSNNDHDRKFCLIVNCPAWIELASHPEFQATFEKQLRMVIQHEMAHFVHQGSNPRSETHAHCRGIAAAFARSPVPTSRSEFLSQIKEEHPEVENNPEMRELILERGEPTWRLVRRWINNFKRHATSL